MVTDFKSFYELYNTLYRKHCYTNNWLGLLGKTYENKTTVSSKAYFQFLHKLSKEEYPFPCNYELYDKFYKFIDLDRSNNNCFSIKIDNNNNTMYNFHIKLNKFFNFKEHDILEKTSLINYQKAVSVEFNNKETQIRRYYYINDRNIKKVLDIFNIKEDVNLVKYLEYTHNPSKIIIIYKNPQNSMKGIMHNLPFYIVNDINKTKKICNVAPQFFGIYRHIKKYTVYWDLNKQNDCYNNFLKI